MSIYCKSELLTDKENKHLSTVVQKHIFVLISLLVMGILCIRAMLDLKFSLIAWSMSVFLLLCVLGISFFYINMTWQSWSDLSRNEKLLIEGFITKTEKQMGANGIEVKVWVGEFCGNGPLIIDPNLTMWKLAVGQRVEMAYLPLSRRTLYIRFV
jgi:hypothetical protein